MCPSLWIILCCLTQGILHQLDSKSEAMWMTFLSFVLNDPSCHKSLVMSCYCLYYLCASSWHLREPGVGGGLVCKQLGLSGKWSVDWESPILSPKSEMAPSPKLLSHHQGAMSKNSLLSLLWGEEDKRGKKGGGGDEGGRNGLWKRHSHRNRER